MLQELRLQVLQMRLTKSSTATTDYEHSNANAVAEEMGILLATHAQNWEITIEIANVAEELTVSSATFFPCTFHALSMHFTRTSPRHFTFHHIFLFLYIVFLFFKLRLNRIG